MKAWDFWCVLNTRICEICKLWKHSQVRLCQLAIFKGRSNVTTSYREMYRHQQHFPGSTNRGKRYRCEFCYVVKFSEERDLNHHMKLHMEGSLFRCHICREFFKFKHRLKVHMRAHMGKTIYRCDECNYSAETRYHLNVHKRIHTGEKSFICNICKKSFS